ncbi:ABC transporter ATP-binding protein [Oscillospiraceae bacterium MB08-C2-2]|nr:ABC transporter ATP-binding protein [Oscillospiraceae bacterium MB08-C2-2]
MALIELQDFSYQYPASDEFSLKNITLDIHAGDFIGIIGANGSGKTTLCNAIRGFVPSFYKGNSFGKVLLEGKDLAEIPLGDLSTRIGYVFQNPFNQISYVKETVFDEICYGLENLGVDPADMRHRTQAIMEELRIAHLSEKNPFALSGGQQQRVALASILVMDPDILVIDEPTSQLDPLGTEQVFDILDLVKHRGKTVILVEHKIEHMARYANRIVVMEDGRILAEGPTGSILSSKKLLQHGTQIPSYARLGHLLRENGYEVEKIPITHEQSLEMLQGILAKGAVNSESH